jgi:ribosomal protein S18 acetylase RimI-like enzyme
MSIRPAENSDLPAVAAIHQRQFETHFLGQYSTKLLECFYRSFLGKSLFLVHETENDVDGFVMGGESADLNSCEKAFIRENLPRCCWETIFRPHVWRGAIWRGAATVKSLLRRHEPRQDVSSDPNIRILSIAVEKSAMGSGAATALVKAFEEIIFNNHIEQYGLSVLQDNHRAIRFYEKMGFVIDRNENKCFYLSKKFAPSNDERPGNGGKRC